jgi:hypothetical protein
MLSEMLTHLDAEIAYIAMGNLDGPAAQAEWRIAALRSIKQALMEQTATIQSLTEQLARCRQAAQL